MSLTEFLFARIAEDEAAAREPLINASYQDPVPSDCWAPERVLAECEAKRRIVDYRERVARESADTGVPLFEAQLSAYDATLRALALPYADHTDYREEWKP